MLSVEVQHVSATWVVLRGAVWYVQSTDDCIHNRCFISNYWVLFVCIYV